MEIEKNTLINDFIASGADLSELSFQERQLIMGGKVSETAIDKIVLAVVVSVVVGVVAIGIKGHYAKVNKTNMAIDDLNEMNKRDADSRSRYAWAQEPEIIPHQPVSQGMLSTIIVHTILGAEIGVILGVSTGALLYGYNNQWKGGVNDQLRQWVHHLPPPPRS